MDNSEISPSPIVVELPPQLSRAAVEMPLRIQNGLTELFDELGIPERPSVEIKTGQQTVNNLRVRLQGKSLTASLELLRDVAGFFSMPQAEILNLNSAWAGAISKAFPENSLGDFLAHLAVELIKQKPELLFGTDQALIYLQQCKQAIPNLASEWVPLDRFKTILRYILRQRLSIRNIPLIIEEISEGIKAARSDVDIVEGLIPRLCPDQIEVELSPDYARELLNIELAEGESVSAYDVRRIKDEINLFNLLRDGLFYELGIKVPDVVIVASHRVRPMAFSFRLNHVRSAAQSGLTSGQVLVNDTVENLAALGIEASLRINPANGFGNALVNQSEKKRLEEQGLIVWTPLGYLILALARQLRRHASCLIHSEIVEYELSKLRRIYPELINALLGVPLSRVTRTLRELLREEISIRNLKVILERILTCDYIVTDPTKYIVFDDRLAVHVEPDKGWRDDGHSLVQHTRAGLKHYISDKYTRGQASLSAFLMDIEIEKLLLEHLDFERGEAQGTALSEEKVELISSAIRNEVGDFMTTSLPVILTSPEIRYLLRRLIETEYPTLPVLSWDELLPILNIQPIARIGL